MNPVGIPTPLGADFEIKKSSRWKLWLFFLLLAILFHVLVFLIHVEWNPEAITPPPVEIQQVNPAKLDAIRKQWKEKGLLLDQDKSKPSEKEAPPDARYMSDRNIRVEKEQKAAETNVIPKPGHPNGTENEMRRAVPKQHRLKPPTSTQKLPRLGNLGVPMKLESEPQPPPETTENESNESSNSTPLGGSQYIQDKNLPTGSENLLNAQESVYYSFYSRLYEAIGPIWQSRLRGSMPRSRVLAGDYTTSVDVVLDESGNLVEIRRLQTSGVPEFDEAVDQSWRKIQRFPNPPKGLLDRENRVHTGWTFTVHVGEGFQFNSLPPERNY